MSAKDLSPRLSVRQLCPSNSLSLSLPIHKGQIYFSVFYSVQNNYSDSVLWCGQAPSLVSFQLKGASLIFMGLCTVMSLPGPAKLDLL